MNIESSLYSISLAPKLASEIKKYTEHKNQLTGENKIDYVANTVAHAILGAVVAELQGNSGLAGGAGAVGGEIAADIIRKAIYAGKDVKDLTESEKQNISALAQLAAGLAIAAGGGDVGDVGTAISGSKNAVENNYLSKGQMHDYINELQECSSSVNSEQCVANVKNKYDEIDERQHNELVEACSANPYSSECFNYIKNAVEGGLVLFTKADLNSLVGEAGNYSIAELCKELPNSCSTILNNQDWKNQQDADYNLHNPILIAERAKDARYILGHIGIDTTDMSDKEAVDKVNEIGLMASARIIGRGKGKDNTKDKVNQVKPQLLDPKFANDTWFPIKRFELVQKDGVWYTVGNNGTMFRARGTYDYVTINGKIYVSNTSSSSNVGHFDISRGTSKVDYAGSVKFGRSDGTRGILQGFDNSSGHYKPSANDALQSGFPLDKFKDIHDVK